MNAIRPGNLLCRAVLAITAPVLLSMTVASAADGSPGASAEIRARREAAERRFLQEYPGVNLLAPAGRITRVYGGIFSQGVTPFQSAERFRERHARMFGVNPQDLWPAAPVDAAAGYQPLVYQPESGDYKFTLVRYRQQVQDLPVFGGELRVLVRNTPNHPAVWAGSALRDVGAFEIGATLRDRLRRDGLVAERFAPAREAALSLFPELVEFSAPEVVVWAGMGEAGVEPRVALSFLGDDGVSGGGEGLSLRFVADLETGRILHHESRIVRFDVVGNVSGLATEGDGADICFDEVATPMPYLAVSSGGNTAFSDADGNYVIPDGGATVEATVDGMWFDVFNVLGAVETVSGPSTSDLLFNAANDDEYVRAQTNAYVQANRVRDYAARYNPDYPTFDDTDIRVTVNNDCTATAWYYVGDPASPTGYSINFCKSQTGPPAGTNTAFSSVVHHEFGHHLIQAAGSGQGDYGEGMADTVAVLVNDSPACARGIFTDCSEIPLNAVNDEQYPCTGFCAFILMGSVWDTRMKLWYTDPDDYIDILGNLGINAILLHTGTAIDPGITVDYLTLDDDDADLNNGTPHYDQIAAGFGNHSMVAPHLGSGLVVFPVDSFDPEGVAGGPFLPSSRVYTVQNQDPAAITYTATVSEPWLTVTNGTGSLAPGGSAAVTVEVNAEADALIGGVYEDTLEFTNWTNHDGDQSRGVVLDVNRGQFEPTDTPMALPKLQTTASTITVDQAGCIGDVDVTVDIDHDDVGTLEVTVIAPTTGKSVVLHAVGTDFNSGIHTTYDEEGGTLPDGPGALSDFKFDDPLGTWTLEMQNNSYLSDGTLNDWSLRIQNLGSLCPPQADDVNGTVPSLATGDITLAAVSPRGRRINYIISSLPDHGELADPNGGPIDSVPYTLASFGKVVSFTPVNGYVGPDRFTYRADDGTESREADVFVTVGIQTSFLIFDFESDPGWTATGGWAFGTPLGGGTRGLDPTSGYTGINVFGYNLAGDYPGLLGEETLTSVPIDCSDFVAVGLSFRRWLGVEGSASDSASVQASNDGSTWVTVWANPSNSMNDQSWELHTADLSGVADRQPEVYLRWVMGPTDGTITYQGWNIDDVELAGVDAPPIITLTVGRTVLSWTSMEGAAGYDLVRGDLGLLRVSGGDFSQAVSLCVENDTGGTVLPYADDPNPGEGHWFLVRGDSGALVRTYDSFAVSQLGLRDDEIEAAAAGCP